MQKGFTLIESLVYIALFAIVMTGVFTSLISITQGSQRIGTRVSLQQEGSFLLSKIDWALTGISSINQPPVGTPETTLETFKTDLGESVFIDFDASSKELRIKRDILGLVEYRVLDNSNVEVSGVVFDHSCTGGTPCLTKPEWVKASFTLSTKTPSGQIITQDFETTKYLRK